MRMISRDPFTRQELHGETILTMGRLCSWCGQMKHGKNGGFLYRYFVEENQRPGRRLYVHGLYCSVGCMRAYYGIAWKRRGEGWHFVYGVGMETDEEIGGIVYCLFDWADVPQNTDPETRWNWARFEDVADACSMKKEDLLNLPLTHIVECLVSYYGWENVFGSSYFPFPIRFNK